MLVDSLNVEGYPLKIESQKASDTSTSTRAMTDRRPIEIGKSNLISNSCISDAIKIWNQAPDLVRKCETLTQIKKAARLYAKTLPV